MSSYFAFQASDALSQQSLLLTENFEKGVKDPQNRLFIEVAQLYTDEIIDALLLNIVNAPGADVSGAGMLKQFAGMIKSTVNGLIKQVLGKMSNDELQALAGYMREHRLELPSRKDGELRAHVAFAIPDEFYQQFSSVLERGGAGEQTQPELQPCMDRFADMAIKAFYDDSLKSVKLGFIGRKLADVGSSAIHKGAQAATRRLVPALKDNSLKRFSDYFRSMLIQA